MKNIILLLIHVLLISACSSKSDNNFNNSNSENIVTLTVSFQYGESLSPTAYKNIYVIWIENKDSLFLQNLFVCKKLMSGGLTGTVLPYWKLNKYQISLKSEVDAVTSATNANCDFSVKAKLKDNDIRKFTVYFETDRSYEPNDWFADQPALLYSAEIDLDNDKTEYELVPFGWTPNENTENIIPGTPTGKVQKEMRYITNLKSGSSFGSADTRSATRMVRNLTVKIEGR